MLLPLNNCWLLEHCTTIVYSMALNWEGDLYEFITLICKLWYRSIYYPYNWLIVLYDTFLSIYTHSTIQVFKKLNLSTQLFSHLLEGLSYGCPPHGGIALGFDRLMAILCNASSLREVIAFPKTTTGNELMTGSPAEVSSSQLAEFGLTFVANNNNNNTTNKS